MSKSSGRPKVAGLGFHKNLGQYRKVVNGRSIYFGSDPDEALARYRLFTETGLIWKRGFSQFCLERQGRWIPFGSTLEVARRNFAAQKDQDQVTRVSVSGSDFVVNTVREVAEAYLRWLITTHKSSQHITQRKQHFRELLKLQACGDVALENLTVTYFKNWYRHCWEQVAERQLQNHWANRRMLSIKAAFLRCRKEAWLGVALPDLPAMLAVLQKHGGPQQQQSIFSPEELRRVLRTSPLPDRLAILIGLNCAVGNTDMGRLRWGDLSCRKFGERTEWLFEQARGKTGRRRRKPLWPLTAKTLLKWKAVREKQGVTVDPRAFIFTTRDGGPIAAAGTSREGHTWRHDAMSAAV